MKEESSGPSMKSNCFVSFVNICDERGSEEPPQEATRENTNVDEGQDRKREKETDRTGLERT